MSRKLARTNPGMTALRTTPRHISADGNLPIARSGRTGRMIEISVDLVTENPHQPRQSFDPAEAQALQESIERYGLLEPIGVAAQADGSYRLVFGERRLRAVRALGHETVAAVLISAEIPADEVSIVENLQRVDLNPFEAADAIAGLMERRRCSQADVGRLLGLDKAEVSRTLTLLRLPAILRAEYPLHRPPMSILRDIAKAEPAAEQLRRWEAYKAIETRPDDAMPPPAAGHPADVDGAGPGAPPRLSNEPPEVALSALSKRVARHLLSVRNALHALREKPGDKPLAKTDRDLLLDMRAAIDAILAGQGS